VVAYVWDVFDRNKDRAQRVSDSLQVTGDNSDPWRIVGEAALDSVAAKSADDLAAFLSYTPEAVAVAASAQAPAPDAKTLSYAPAE
jgi:muconolactone delta-isomerase